jgi:Ca2+/Na+ antiporter
MADWIGGIGFYALIVLCPVALIWIARSPQDAKRRRALTFACAGTALFVIYNVAMGSKYNLRFDWFLSFPVLIALWVTYVALALSGREKRP